MSTLTLVLWLVIAVLISAVIDRLIPRVSLPLIQVVMGVLIAISAGSMIEVDFDPELFLVLFIAPLLYLEAKDADKAQLWKNKAPILSLAIGLVIVSTLIIGFSVHALIPYVPIAAAVALGAALGPTDAVAVTSLSKQVSIPKRQWGMLKGELLLNDASGIVAFQFAIAAIVTGTFSLLEASEMFVYEFIGGLLFGLLLGYFANFVLRKIRDLGVDSTTFHVLYEICVPFVIYIASSAIHVSGIIAVVVAGLVNVIAPRSVSPSIAHMNIVSSSVWQVISFALNGVVFVMLGTQIPTAMFYTWKSDTVDNVTLVFYILFVTAILMGVRFLWCAAMELTHILRNKQRGKISWGRFFRNVAVMTFCGAKGTITLSILFTIPFLITGGKPFPSRSLIVFMGCGVILCTLLIANFLVPLVCPKKKRTKTELEARRNYYSTLNDILVNVISQITAQQSQSNLRSTSQVIKLYRDRLERTKQHLESVDEFNVDLRLEAIKLEQACVLDELERGEVPRDIGLKFLRRLERQEDMLRQRTNKNLLEKFLGYLVISFHQLQLAVSNIWNRRKLPKGLATEETETLRKLQVVASRKAAEMLHNKVANNDADADDASKLLLMYEQRIARISGSLPSVSAAFEIADDADDIQRLAYQIELEEIQKMYESDRITRQEAARLRDNVNLMRMDLDEKV